jgi:hypothetical protein
MSKEPRLKDEINYYEEISKVDNKCSIFFPRLLSYSSRSEGYSMELEYYAYNNLGDYMVYGEFDRDFWEVVAEALDRAMNQFLKTHQPINTVPHTTAMYINKTERYYWDLVNNFDKFRSLAGAESLVINGERCLNFESLWGRVKEIIRNKLLVADGFSIIHGDFCFSNILCGINKKTNTAVLKFVDPRGNFGVNGIFGDPAYDSAKLLHSYEGGYEYIIYDQFDVEENSAESRYSIKFSNDNKDKIADIFSQRTYFRSIESKLIEGLIYIGMCSRHYDSTKRQTAMYLTGVKILNEVLKGETR